MLTVAYCRVSTEEQAAEGFSIEGQAERLRAYGDAASGARRQVDQPTEDRLRPDRREPRRQQHGPDRAAHLQDAR